jgi:hypothetical protein
MRNISPMPPNPMVGQPASEDLPATVQGKEPARPVSGQQQAAQPQSPADAADKSASNPEGGF